MLEAFDFTSFETVPPGVDPGEEAAPAVSAEDIGLLCEIGIMALAMQRGEEARPIFQFLDERQPHNAAGAIGLAMVEVATGREREALSRLRSAILTRRTCVREAKAVLAVLLMGFGRHGEAKPLRRELLRGPDCGARRLIQTYGAV